MSGFIPLHLGQVKVGIAFCVIGLLFGIGLGSVFGLFEDNIKSTLNESAKSSFVSVYKSDQAKVDKIIKKSWHYIKRAHFHSTGMSTMAIVLIFILSQLPILGKLKTVTAAFLGIGAVGYPLSWLLAGFLAPGLGSTGKAKESVVWLAAPSIGMFSIGIIIFCIVILFYAFNNKAARAF